MQNKAKTVEKKQETTPTIDIALNKAIEDGILVIGYLNAVDVDKRAIMERIVNYVKGDAKKFLLVKNGISLQLAYEKMNKADKIRLLNNLNYLRIKCGVVPRSYVGGGGGGGVKVVKTQAGRTDMLKKSIKLLLKKFDCELSDLSEMFANTIAEMEEEEEAKEEEEEARKEKKTA